jgi:segregation and condensation protein A
LMQQFEVEKNRPVHQIYTYSYTVETQRDYILSKLERGKKADFVHIFAALEDRVHAIVTFLALLEMLNRQEIRIIQGEGINNFWLTFIEESENEIAETETEDV